MSGKLDQRLAALREAADLAAGRLDDADVEAARAVVERAGARLGLGLESTVVALAGPTGVGKSLLFNVLTGAELAAVGRRRPTTAAGQAAIWGEGGDALLDWLEIGRRHRVADDGLGGLVLLDLPDFDSIEASHRLEAERVVGLADLVLWVVEPQKYADASLHDRYLRPLATHAAAMGVVLNQADLLGTDDVEAWRRDMERLLERDGLPKLPLVVVSARDGDGVPELRRLLAERVAARDAAVAKLAADLEQAAEPLAASCEGRARGVRAEDSRRLQEALEEAAGVPTVVRAVRDAHRRRGSLATGWPLIRWLRRFRPDPLRRLRLSDSPAAADAHVDAGRRPTSSGRRSRAPRAAWRTVRPKASRRPGRGSCGKRPSRRMTRWRTASTAPSRAPTYALRDRAGGASPAGSRARSRSHWLPAVCGSQPSRCSAGSGSRTLSRSRSSRESRSRRGSCWEAPPRGSCLLFWRGSSTAPARTDARGGQVARSGSRSTRSRRSS